MQSSKNVFDWSFLEKTFTGPAIFCLALLLTVSLPACAAQNNGANGGEYIAPASSAVITTPGNTSSQTEQMAGDADYDALPPVWRPLAMRLARDGIGGPQAMRLLEQLAPQPTQSPMGRKIRELYKRQFMPSARPAKGSQQYYKGVVTQANARLCRQFINENEAAFHAAQTKYGVPPAIASALLFVETRLGKVLADVPENAFYTLASMAVTNRPEDIGEYLPSLPGYEKHLPWLRETMRKRADWAYNETRALMEHMLRDHISPANLPSSIYGAVGLCQFMPSNISVYGADGDGDGRVDLFNIPDAVASLANYLARHGWKAGISTEARHKVLMSYNHSRVYANTILALAALVAGEEVPALSKSPQKTRGKSK